MARGNTIRLTKTAVEGLPTTGKRYWVFDSELPGFAVRVQTTGSKTFAVMYRPGGGRSSTKRNMTLGTFGKLTVEEARRQAKIMLGKVAIGKDPAGEILAKRREMKMDELLDLYEREGCAIQRGIHQGRPMKPLSKKLLLARLRNHVRPLLGSKRLPDIGTGEVETFYADVARGKTSVDEKIGFRSRLIVKGGDGAARKVFRDLSAVFSFAKRRGLIDRNPCENAAVRKVDNRRSRFLTLDELARLGKAIDQLEKDGANPKALNIIRLWALTGCRHEEIAALKWSEINFEASLLELDDTKTGRSVRPLGIGARTLLLSLLEKRAKDDASPFVFPAERGERFYQGTEDWLNKAIAKANLPGVTPHTFRHTMGSTSTSFGEPLLLTGSILGHANVRSTMIYAHVQHDPSVKSANRISAKIAAALNGDATPKAGGKQRKAAPNGKNANRVRGAQRNHSA